MGEIAVRVEEMGKRFTIGSTAPYHRLSEVITNLGRQFGNAIRRPPRNHQQASSRGLSTNEFWALKDVSFEVKEGEVVGIIGRNGAGKSTLLKILSRITEPTTGQFGIKGRVGSLLEVGTGFHPELTGRENMYLSGTILGMSRRDVKRHFDEIVAFAEVEPFVDTPVKRYSSGMYVRLGFAIAAHLNPEILIVDEVLAVGDAVFQKKCLGKMGDVANSGRTVLFVSHNMAAVKQLTRRCVVLKHGRLTRFSATEDAIAGYLEQATIDLRDAEAGYGTGMNLDPFRRDKQQDSPVRLLSAGVRLPGRCLEPMPTIPFAEDFEFVCEIESRIKTECRLGFSLYRPDGIHAVLVFSQDVGAVLPVDAGRHTIACRVRGLPLAPGRYFTQVGLSDVTPGRTYDVLIDYPLMNVQWSAVDDGTLTYTQRKWGGVQWDNVDWNIGPATSESTPNTPASVNASS